MAKNHFLEGTFIESMGLDAERIFPSIKCLSKEEAGELEGRIKSIVEFHSKCKLPFQAVDFLSKKLLENNFEKREIFENSDLKNKNYFYLDPWQKSSMIIVKEGKRPITDGFHLIMSHADSPCLKIKPRPLRVEFDHHDIYDYLGVRLSTIPHGGIVVPYWVGQQVQIIGYTINQDGTRREINFPGLVGATSAHIDYSDLEPVVNSFPSEKSLEVKTGYPATKNILNFLKFENLDDFANTHLWAVPTNEMSLLNEKDKTLLVGYGHDNRTTIFSATDAIIQSKNPEYTSVLWISDDEEIGDPAPVGTKGPLFEMFLGKILENQSQKEKRKISNSEKYKMYADSRIIIGDVTIAPSGFDEENMDKYSAAKIGLGVYIEDGDIRGANPYFIRELRKFALGDENEKGICHQISGGFYHQDKVNLRYSICGDSNNLISKGVPEIWAGIPCASCHSTVEIICPGDEYATFKLYKRFFEK